MRHSYSKRLLLAPGQVHLLQRLRARVSSVCCRLHWQAIQDKSHHLWLELLCCLLGDAARESPRCWHCGNVALTAAFPSRAGAGNERLAYHLRWRRSPPAQEALAAVVGGGLTRRATLLVKPGAVVDAPDLPTLGGPRSSSNDEAVAARTPRLPLDDRIGSLAAHASGTVANIMRRIESAVVAALVTLAAAALTGAVMCSGVRGGVRGVSDPASPGDSHTAVRNLRCAAKEGAAAEAAALGARSRQLPTPGSAEAGAQPAATAAAAAAKRTTLDLAGDDRGALRQRDTKCASTT
jgi:hypothetical protein